MAFKKTCLQKIIKAIESSNLKQYRLDNLSLDTGIKVATLEKDLVEIIPLIYFDYEINLKDYLNELKKQLVILNASPVKKKAYTKKDIDKYNGFIDYIYQNMTDNGGLFDSGYVLTKKDIKILKRLLKDESLKFKDSKKKK